MVKLIDKIKTDSITAMKDGNKSKLSTIRLLIAELEKEKISLKLSDVTSLTNENVETVISRQIKKLDKEIEAYVAVSRSVESQNIEKELLISYLPKQLDDEEIRAEVQHAINLVSERIINNPMQHLSKELKGKADMTTVMKIVKELTSKKEQV